jgi:hypothetical protein
MATAHEQQLAKDILVAWLTSASTIRAMEGLQNPTTAGTILADLYKTLVKAVSETSTPAEGRDATG